MFFARRRSLVAFLGLGGILALWACSQEPPQLTERVRAIKTITVASRTAGIPRKFPGVVEAVDTSTLSFEVSGNVQEVRVDVGDGVQKGQLLAVLDKRDFRLQGEAAQAELTRERAVQTQRRKDFERLQSIFKEDPGATSQAALDEAQAAFESSQSTVSYALSKLDLVRRDLEKTALVAPFDGIIAKRHIDAFQEISRGQSAFDVFAEGAMEVAISIPETLIDCVTIGLTGEIRFPTAPGFVLPGQVSEVSAVAGTANAFPAKLAIRDGNKRVLPGMTAEVTLQIAAGVQGDGFLLPVDAVTAGNETNKGYVFVFDPSSSAVQKKRVTISGFRDNAVIVASGVQAGDIVAIAGVSFLEDGQTVKLLESQTKNVVSN